MSYFKQDEPLLQLNCALCFQIFTICRSCYRRHRYCSKRCSKKARKLKNRISNKNYRKTRKGKLNQAKRQNFYRNKNKVTDQSSNSTVSNANAELNCSTEEITSEQIRGNKKQEEGKKDGPSFSNEAKSSSISMTAKFCCIFCGRPADFVISLIKYQSKQRGPPKKSFLI